MFKIISNNKSLEYCDNFTKFNGEIISNNQEPTPLYNSLEAFCAKAPALNSSKNAMSILCNFIFYNLLTNLISFLTSKSQTKLT